MATTTTTTAAALPATSASSSSSSGGGSSSSSGGGRSRSPPKKGYYLDDVADGTSMWDRVIEFRNESRVLIREEWVGDAGLGGTLYDGSILLCRYFDCVDEFADGAFDRRHLLELGAGCGLVGIRAAQLGFARVTLTDLACALPNMRACVDENLAGDAAVRARVAIDELPWGVADAAAAAALRARYGTPDFVVASECVYRPELLPPILQTMHALCGADTRVLITGFFHHTTAAFHALAAAMFDVVEKVPRATRFGGPSDDLQDHRAIWCLRRTRFDDDANSRHYGDKSVDDDADNADADSNNDGAQ